MAMAKPKWFINMLHRGNQHVAQATAQGGGQWFSRRDIQDSVSSS